MPAWLVESLVAGVSITATATVSSNKVIVPTATFAGCANETAKILPGPSKTVVPTAALVTFVDFISTGYVQKIYSH